jgi:putative ABC transport system ATP-binding protein
MPGADHVLQVRRLRKSFESDGMPVRALRRVDLTIDVGEFVALTGPSGCGKSTLLNLVAGLDVPDDGEIELDGIALTGLDESDRARLRRRHIGMVFQFFNLLDDLTVFDNVVLPAQLAGAGRGETGRRATELLTTLGIARHASPGGRAPRPRSARPPRFDVEGRRPAGRAVRG